MRHKFSDVSSKYGAPMGRRDVYEPGGNTKVKLFRVEMVDGDYDNGGAYWGGYPALPLYVAIGDGIELFMRGKTREEAKSKLLEDYPDLKFYR